MQRVIDVLLRLGFKVSLQLNGPKFELLGEHETRTYNGKPYCCGLTRDQGLPTNPQEWARWQRDGENLVWQVQQWFNENPEINAAS